MADLNGFNLPTSAPPYSAPIANQVSQIAVPILSGIAGGFPVPSSGSGTTTGNSQSQLTGNVSGVTNTSGNVNSQGTQSGTTNQQGQSYTSGTQASNLSNLLNTLSQLTNNQQTTNNFGSQGNQLLSSILPQLGQLLQAPNLAPYQASQIANINANSNIANQAAQNILAARGLSTSPVAAALSAGQDMNRVNQITQLQQQIPLLRQQMLQSGVNTAGSILSQLPRVTSTAGTQSQTGTQSQVGQSGTSNYGSTQNIGSQQTQGTQSQNQNQSQVQNTNTNQSQNQNTQSNQNTQQQQQQGGGIGGILGGIGSALASLFL